jgi:hypothetical protein
MLDDSVSYTILGVVKRMPKNSHFNFGMLMPIYNHPQRKSKVPLETSIPK